MDIDLLLKELDSLGVNYINEVRHSFINLKLKDYPYTTIRIDDRMGFRSLHKDSLTFKSFKWTEYPKRYEGLAKILKAKQMKLDKLVTSNKSKLEKMRVVIEWTSQPGRLDLIPAIDKLRFKSKTILLYRGMTIDKDTLSRILNAEHHSEYSSWTTLKKNALAYSKGRAGAEIKQFSIVFKARIKPILNVKEFTDQNPDLLALAESGYFGLEPGTLYEDEYIAKPFKLKGHHILEVRERVNGKYVLRKQNYLDKLKES